MEVYLDNSATTRVRPEVLQAIIDVCDVYYGNPSSLHRKGLEIEKKIDAARKSVAGIINCLPTEIYFTGGGTESNNIAIFGHLEKASGGMNIVTSKIEHPSVYNVFKHFESRAEVRLLDTDDMGRISLDQLYEAVDENTALVSIMMVNNEVGSVNDIIAVTDVVKKKNHRTRVHIDAIQGFGKLKIDVKKVNADTISFSSHKVHGPKGVGGLYVRKGIGLSPLAFGGSQEKGLRPGTENTPGIVGFGVACDLITQDFEKEVNKLYQLKEAYAGAIVSSLEDVKINGPVGSDGAPHILSLSFSDVRGEVLVHWLENEGVYVSTGSACSSKSKKENRILNALSLDSDYAEGTIRLSFGYFNTMDEVSYAAQKIKEAVDYIREIIK